MTKKIITYTMIGALAAGSTSSVFAQENAGWIDALEGFLYNISDNIDELTEDEKEVISKLSSAILAQMEPSHQ